MPKRRWRAASGRAINSDLISERVINPRDESNSVRTLRLTLHWKLIAGEPDMPLARIDLTQGKSAEYRRTLGDIVYEAMVDVLRSPRGDQFQDHCRASHLRPHS